MWVGGSIPSRAAMIDLFAHYELPDEFEHPNQIGWAIRARTVAGGGTFTSEELAPLGTPNEYVFRKKQEAELYYDTIPENLLDMYTTVDIVPVCIPRGKRKMSWLVEPAFWPLWFVLVGLITFVLMAWLLNGE